MNVIAVLTILAFVMRVIKASDGAQPCGHPQNTNNRLSRIVGGYEVGYYKYPWFAALIRDKDVNCGGTLIAPRTVVTAAHCYKPYIDNKTKLKPGYLESLYSVRLGVYNVCKSESSQKEYKVIKVLIHELYPIKSPYYDICLLTLDKNTDEFLPACLPIKVLNSNTRPKEGTVQGLGRLKYQGDTPCTLHEARVLIYSDGDCKKMINSTGNDENALQHAICAGYMSGGIDACQGDSGGPLLVIDYDGRYFLQGITSYGFGCAQSGVLGVYTDVSHFVEWIKSKLNHQSNHSTEAYQGNSTDTEHGPSKHPNNAPLKVNPFEMTISTGGKTKITITTMMRTTNRHQSSRNLLQRKKIKTRINKKMHP